VAPPNRARATRRYSAPSAAPISDARERVLILMGRERVVQTAPRLAPAGPVLLSHSGVLTRSTTI
jgi:hypothetical protein